MICLCCELFADNVRMTERSFLRRQFLNCGRFYSSGGWVWE